MSFSDDENDDVPHIVSNYYFVDENNEPVSFWELPIHWNELDELDVEEKEIFLRGTADNGLRIYKQVLAWKFDIADLRPEIFVLSKESNWIRLLKPRKSYEDMIRSILITLHFLHFVRKKPETSWKLLWDHLSRDFSCYETVPSEMDLMEHIGLITEVFEREEILAKSKFLMIFLKEKPWKKKDLDEEIRTVPRAGFIVDDDMIDNFEGADGSDDEEDLFDNVCSICDNGGDVLCCEGRCLRSFHATKESDKVCKSLGLTKEQVEETPIFICRNCEHQQHQCFACGELGSSNKSYDAEVFQCASATCGYFYHLSCVAKLLHCDNAAAAEEFQKKVSAGGTFTCPIHKCFKCKKGEDKIDHDLQFAVCRRCPKSYHRKCLPSEITLSKVEDEDGETEDEEDEDEGIPPRAWENLIPNRILMYCLKHKIDEKLKTPVRDHIKFSRNEPEEEHPQQVPRKKKALPRKKIPTSEDELNTRNPLKVRKRVRLTSVRRNNMPRKKARKSTVPYSLEKTEAQETSEEKSSSPVLGNKLYDDCASKSVKSLTGKVDSEKVIENPAAMDISSSVQLDNDSKQRIMALLEHARSSVTMEQILEKRSLPKNQNFTKYAVDKMTLGKVEDSVEAIRVAIKRLDEGGSLEDAKEVCQPEDLEKFIRWKNTLKGYLTPFLHGNRYTSHGRHFTDVEKLKEIVNLLHPYVQNDDMIVDFCCGSNDFSLLMKTKLDETGKECLYKNYDLIQTKNDFNFEKRDWYKVQTNELPKGPRLIMGLNPPFGVNASLANKFINKALEFKPKLLILIAPKETERLDKKKKMPYDLIWEDNTMLSGNAFYLPGSVDVNDNQLEDWNNSPPLLSLWSHPDWTAKHVAIAQKHGHLSWQDEERYKSRASDFTDQVPLPLNGHPVENKEQVLHSQTLQELSENLEECGHGDDCGIGVDRDRTHKRDEIDESSKKRKRDKDEHVRESVTRLDKSEERERHKNESRETSQENEKRGGNKFRDSPPRATDGEFPRHGSCSDTEASRERDHHSSRNLPRTNRERDVSRERGRHPSRNAVRTSPGREAIREKDRHSSRNLPRTNPERDVSRERFRHPRKNAAQASSGREFWRNRDRHGGTYTAGTNSERDLSIERDRYPSRDIARTSSERELSREREPHPGRHLAGMGSGRGFSRDRDRHPGRGIARTSTERGLSRERDPHPGRDMARTSSEREFCRGRDHHRGKNLAGTGSGRDFSAERRCGSSSYEAYGDRTDRRSGPCPNHGYMNPEEHFGSYQKETLVDSRGYRPPYTYNLEKEYAKSAARPRAWGMYDEPHDHPPSLGQRYGFLRSGQDPAYTSRYSSHMGSSDSIIQRYTPNLNETNHMRMNNPVYNQFGAYPGSLAPPQHVYHLSDNSLGTRIPSYQEGPGAYPLLSFLVHSL